MLLRKNSMRKNVLKVVFPLLGVIGALLLSIHLSYENAWTKERDAFLNDPKTGTCFIFVFEEDKREFDQFSIARVESVSDGHIVIGYNRRAAWEQGMAMTTAEKCRDHPKQCTFKNQMTLTLEEFKKIDLCNVFLPTFLRLD